MTFTILSEANITKILGNLTPPQLQGFVQALEQGLSEYSCQDGASYQSERGVVTRPGGQVSLFMPATTSDMGTNTRIDHLFIGVKVVGVRPSGKEAAPSKQGEKPKAGLKSVLTLCDPEGEAIGVLNAAGLTAFRTSLGSMLLFRFRKAVSNIVVFGAGKQALWHIRLAVLLRGQDIRKITIVNRSSARTEDLLSELQSPEIALPAHISLAAFSPGPEDYATALSNLVVDADALFCTTPSTQPLFPASVLDSPQAKQKSRYISAIGSYRLDMQEIDPQHLQTLTDPSSDRPFPTYKGGVVAVDSVHGCLSEAGEVVKAGIPVERMLEVGGILKAVADESGGELDEWLGKGDVVYKSVGVGVMDLAIGRHLLNEATAQGVGLKLDEF